MFRRRRASESPRDVSVGPAEDTAPGNTPSSDLSAMGAGTGSDVRTDTTAPSSTTPNPAGSPATPTSAASDPKGQAMSASTPPRSPGQGFVPEIPRRSAADIPGAPTRRPVGRVNEESKRLLVGRDISLSGEITACDSLVVEGTVQATLEHSRLLEVAETGLFKGRVTIEEAVIAGRFEGELTVSGTLTIKGKGVLEGTVRFAKLEVELGGVIKGDIAPISEG